MTFFFCVVCRGKEEVERGKEGRSRSRLLDRVFPQRGEREELVAVVVSPSSERPDAQTDSESATRAVSNLALGCLLFFLRLPFSQSAPARE